MKETMDYYEKAFTEPSFEYIYAYIRIALTLLCVGWVIWFFCLKKHDDKKARVTVNLSDFDDARVKAKASDGESQSSDIDG